MIYKKKLLDINWYLDHMSMFLKESYGIKDQYQWFVDQLNSINFVCDNIVNMLDFYNVLWNKDNPWKFGIKFDDGTSEVKSFKEYKDLVKYFDEKDIKLDFLDMIAKLFGIQREFICTYIDPEGTDLIKETITLSNEELYDYILIVNARNNYDGTYDMIKETYTKAFGEETVVYFTENSASSTAEPLTAHICIIEDELTLNIKKMFRNKEFLIRSLGIQYEVSFYQRGDRPFTLDRNNNLDNPLYKFM